MFVSLLEIDVTFDIDANGIIQVTAEDIVSGTEQQIRIEGGSGLSEDEINRMVKLAEEYADPAGRLRELADVRNHAEVLATEIELSLQEGYDRFTESQVLKVTEQIAKLRQAIGGLDVGEIRLLTKGLVDSADILLNENGETGSSLS